MGERVTKVEERLAAEGRLGQNGTSPTIEPFETYTADALDGLPPPEFLIPGLLPARGLTGLIGESGVGKSFVAIAQSCCIATGAPWNGQPVKQGRVLYVASEGFSGLLPRVDAWRAENGQPRPEGLHFLPETPNLLDPHDAARMVATIAALGDLALIVVDTFARALGADGAEENSSRDQNRFIQQLDRLRMPIGAAGMLVHHPRRDSDIERGSTALRGAADAMLLLKVHGDRRRLSVTKLKDAEEGPPTYLRLARAHGSLVVRFKDDVGGIGPILGGHERKLLELLQDTHGGEPTSTTRLLTTAGIPESSFYFALHRLKDGGFTGQIAEGRARYNQITEYGRRALLQVAPSSSDDAPQPAPSSPPPLGGELAGVDGAELASGGQEAML